MLTFKQFIAESPTGRKPGLGPHGENANDTSEKAMINRIVQLCFDNVKTPENYSTAYDFLESDWGGLLWDKYYELFHQKDPNFEGPQDKPRFTRFKTEARKLFKNFKDKVKFTGTPVKEDVFAKGDELLAAVNTDTKYRTSEPGRINTNRHPLGRITGTTRETPVYYAFSYIPDKEGKTTALLTSLKGKGPYEFTDARRDKFLDDATTHMVREFKRLNLNPDVLITPNSSAEFLNEFATLLAEKLGVKKSHLNAFKKQEPIELPADRAEAIEFIKQKFIDKKYLAAKWAGDLEDGANQIARNVYSNLNRNHGLIFMKDVHKPFAKFVKGYLLPSLDGDDEYSLLDKTVLIVDDYLSSGSTFSEMFRIAKEDLGAAEVFGAALLGRTTQSK